MKPSIDSQKVEIPWCDVDVISICVLKPRETVPSSGILKVEGNG